MKSLVDRRIELLKALKRLGVEDSAFALNIECKSAEELEEIAAAMRGGIEQSLSLSKLCNAVSVANGDEEKQPSEELGQALRLSMESVIELNINRRALAAELQPYKRLACLMQQLEARVMACQDPTLIRNALCKLTSGLKEMRGEQVKRSYDHYFGVPPQNLCGKTHGGFCAVRDCVACHNGIGGNPEVVGLRWSSYGVKTFYYRDVDLPQKPYLGTEDYLDGPIEMLTKVEAMVNAISASLPSVGTPTTSAGITPSATPPIPIPEASPDFQPLSGHSVPAYAAEKSQATEGSAIVLAPLKSWDAFKLAGEEVGRSGEVNSGKGADEEEPHFQQVSPSEGRLPLSRTICPEWERHGSH